MTALEIRPEQLGSPDYLEDHSVKWGYVAGAMVKGIASEDLVVRMGQARLLSFFGSGGLHLERIERAIAEIRRRLRPGQPFGMNLLSNPARPAKEWQTIELFLEHDIPVIEASAFLNITPGLVYYRLKGVRRRPDGSIHVPRRIQAKVSRPEIAAMFLAPPPPSLVAQLAAEGRVTAEEAGLAGGIQMADDLCVEADSGGHTDNGVAFALLPAMLKLRDEATRRYGFAKAARVGAAGGIGTPEAVAAAFIMGAEFVLTGSINQCTVEAGTSDLVKDMLQQAGVQDTEMAPAGDMFELGARIQVLRKGLFFPARANRLYELYRQHSSLDEIGEPVKAQLEKQYFKKSLAAAVRETAEYVRKSDPREWERIENNPKAVMARVFRGYFARTSDAAIQGVEQERTNFQIHCGPAMGAFNQWAKGTPYENWRNRHADELAAVLMKGACAILSRALGRLHAPAAEPCREEQAAYA